MIRAIDVHTHPSDACTHRRQGEWLEHAERYFKQPQKEITLDQQADLYREREMLAVVLALDEETVTGRPPDSNDQLAAAVTRNPDVLIGFGSVDPAKGALAVREVHRCVEDLGLRGMKFMPLTQAFFLDDPFVQPVFEACADLSVPVMIHTGTTGIGAGAPGGMGIRLKYGRPIPHLDDLAAEIPHLTIIGAHPGWPWCEEMIAVMWHKANVFMDLSGWAPKYLPESIVQNANTLLKDRVLFGSDFPVFHPDRWMSEFTEADFRDEVRDGILRGNAARLLGINLDACLPGSPISFT
jgi:hypothetical protein